MRTRYMTVERSCERCMKKFFAYPCEVRRGNARFCSRSCGKLKELAPRVEAGLTAPNDRGCRTWIGPSDKDGYGLVSYMGKTRRVTHAVWFLNTGHWPSEDEVAAHTACDNPPCGEFSHLTLTDTGGNNADRDRKMRQSLGEAHYLAKLNERKVLDMRSLYARGGTSLTTIANIYGVSYATARSAIKGETWKHLEVVSN